jgi:hypothetical protein
MAISPNTNFTSGQILTATAANQWPRGVMARAVSTTNFTLTTGPIQATGMTVTFTAEANRYYKITYYEPQGQTPDVAGNTQSRLFITNTAGTEIGNSVLLTSGFKFQQAMTITKTRTFTAGSVTIIGTGETTSTSGSPVFVRDASREALLLIEDIGPA